jgi:hypothetical protein
VRVDLPADDPRHAARIDIESKLGHTSNGAAVRLQAAKDGEALAENDTLRGVGAGLEMPGRSPFHWPLPSMRCRSGGLT